ncbi:MAG: CD1107 family mobile element protein [Faecalibacterium prausnitzii]
MNLVDEADLLALMEEDAADAYTAEKEAAAQAEQDRLKAEEEAKKAAEEAVNTAEPPNENKVTKYAGAFLGVVALIALAAGGIFYVFRTAEAEKAGRKKPSTPMQTTPRTRVILKFQWRMSRRKPVRRTTQKYNFIGGVCRLTYASDMGCLVVFVTHTTVYGNDVGLFSDYFHIILFRKFLRKRLNFWKP